MPLLKRTKWDLLPMPTDIPDEQMVYCIKFTGEVFVDYEAYLERVYEYMCGQWTCALTGKTGFSYEEALENERVAAEKLNQFPETHLKPVLEAVHHAVGNIESVVDMVYNRYKRELCVDEKVQYRAPGAKSLQATVVTGVHIVPTTKSQAPSPAPEMPDAVEDIKAEATVIANRNNANDVITISDDETPLGNAVVNGKKHKVKKAKPSIKIEYDIRVKKSTLRVPEEQIVRKKLPITRKLLQNFIRRSTTHDLYTAAPWIVKDKYVQMYGLASELPPELLAVKLKFEGRQLKRKREEEEKIQKVQKEKEKEKAVKENALEKIAQEKKETKKRVEVERIRYPVEDTELPIDPALDEMPRMATDFMVGQPNVPFLLVTYHFLSNFNDVISLSQFTFDNWEKAISHIAHRGSQDPQTHASGLMRETISALLTFLIESSADATPTADNENELHALLNQKHNSWGDALQVWIEYRSMTPNPAIPLPECLDNMTPIRALGHDVSTALEMVHYLCNEVASTEEFRTHIDEMRENLRILNAEHRADVSEYRKMLREEEKERKKQNMEEDSGSDSDSDDDGGSSDDDSGQPKKKAKVERADDSQTMEEPDILAKAGASRREMLEYKRMMREMEEARKRKEAEKQAEIRAIQQKERTEQAQIRKEKEQRQAERERKDEKYYFEARRLGAFRDKILGQDRDYRKYWLIDHTRIHIQVDGGKWGYLDTIPEVVQLLNHLNIKGHRECHLRSSLNACFNRLCSNIKKRIEDARREEDSRRSSRLQVKSKEFGFMHFTNSKRGKDAMYPWES